MKHNLAFIAFALITIYSCRKSDLTNIQKCYQDFSGFDLMTDTNSIFPLGSKNFWIYDDSIKRNEDTSIRLLNKSFMITAEKLYQIENKFNSITFNQFISQMTLRNDTLYKTKLSELPGIDCFDYLPFIFKTDTAVFLNPEKTKVLRPVVGLIPTKMGDITYSYIHEEIGGLKYYINPKIGIVRIEILTEEEIIRSYTLNNYYIW